MITIIAGSAVDNYDKIADLIQENWQETGSHKDSMVLDISVEQYRQAEDLGFLFSLFAVDDNEVIGYSINWITNDPHASNDIRAVNNAIFVSAKRRCSPAGLKLIHETEREAVRRGAKVLSWETKPGVGLDKILGSIGYGEPHLIYTKRL